MLTSYNYQVLVHKFLETSHNLEAAKKKKTPYKNYNENKIVFHK